MARVNFGRTPTVRGYNPLANTLKPGHVIQLRGEFYLVDAVEGLTFDIVCTAGPEGHPRLLWEVEVKYSWKTDEWPDSWKELRIPYRKQRLLDKWKNECYNDILTFVVFNHDCTKAWHVDGHTLLDCEVKEVSNRNIRKGEKFFHIPVTDAYLVDMKNESSGGH